MRVLTEKNDLSFNRAVMQTGMYFDRYLSFNRVFFIQIGANFDRAFVTGQSFYTDNYLIRQNFYHLTELL